VGLEPRVGRLGRAIVHVVRIRRNDDDTVGNRPSRRYDGKLVSGWLADAGTSLKSTHGLCFFS